MSKATAEDVLKDFIRDINDTGGVKYDRDGTAAPVADEEWSDLGETYLKACRVLGKKPIVALADCSQCSKKLPADSNHCQSCKHINSEIERWRQKEPS